MVGTLLLGGKTRAELRAPEETDRSARSMPLHVCVVRLPQAATYVVEPAELESAAG